MTNALAAVRIQEADADSLPGTRTGMPPLLPAPHPLILVSTEEREEEADAASAATTPEGTADTDRPARRRRRAETPAPAPPSSDLFYRFPYNRSGIELVPDIKGSFCVRMLWFRGKTPLTIAESTPLRPLGRVTMNGQRFDVFFTQHARKRRERILLAGRRKVALRASRAALRYVVSVTGREDRYHWFWRIGANAAALALPPPSSEAQAELPPDEVRLHLPFAPGKARVLSVPGSASGHALWLNDVALTVVTGVCKGGTGRPELSWDEKGFILALPGARLGGEGVSLEWQTWLSPARTEAEARGALLRHLADAADRLQIPHPAPAPGAEPPLRGLVTRAEAALMAEEAAEKRGVDRLLYRDTAAAGDAAAAGARCLAGETVDAGLAAAALLGRFLQTGDDALRRRARLLANGLCTFQISEEESPHWGAIWDAVRGKGKSVVYEDVRGERTVSIATTARAARALHLLNAHFDVELYQRTALAATQWLILKMDRDGYIAAERFLEDGPPYGGETLSPWVVGEALLPLVETFRATENEVFLKAAMRAVHAFKEGLQDSTLPFELASTEQLASSIEGVLLVSREYEKDDIVALARQLGLGLRARRLPDGSLTEPTAIPASPLVPTLAGARAALALARVDDDPLWLSIAYRALRAAAHQSEAEAGPIQLADQAAFLTLSNALLLAVAARAKGCVADKDKLTITRGWQTFAPDPATREYVKVFAPGPGGEEWPVDYLALVCPISLQVLVAVLAPPSVTEIKVVKNGRSPFVKNLLTGDLDLQAPLSPLGAEANIGVFLADT